MESSSSSSSSNFLFKLNFSLDLDLLTRRMRYELFTKCKEIIGKEEVWPKMCIGHLTHIWSDFDADSLKDSYAEEYRLVDEERYEQWKGLGLELFEISISEHMYYYPMELGQLFEASRFEKSCGMYGEEYVLELVRTNIHKALEQQSEAAERDNRKGSNGGRTKRNNKKLTLQKMVVSAASNDKISPDGLLLLIRMDPVVALFNGNTGKNK